MNCQGWVATERDGETGWIYHAGGGLGARPVLAKRIFDWVPDELAMPVTQAAAEAYRRHGNRRVRAFARLKFVVDKMGAQGFGDCVIEIMKERGIAGTEKIIYTQNPDAEIGRMYLDGQEVVAQRQTGLNAVRIMIQRSELKIADANRLCDWADQFGGGEVMFTNRQNAEIHHVPTASVQTLLDQVHAAGYRTAGHERLPDIVSCVGTSECRMAVADTPVAYHRLYEAFTADQPFWEQVGPIRINMNGCPNNCAHAWIADIGLRGTRMRQDDGTSKEGFSVFLGGKLSEAGRIGQLLGDVQSDEVIPFVRAILDFYLEHRGAADELFTDFVTRTPVEDFRAALELN
jgi:sulfite reductase beta subunit-like hemoprotein